MRLRIRFSRFLLRTGEFIQTLPIVIMKPDDLLSSVDRAMPIQAMSKVGQKMRWLTQD